MTLRFVEPIELVPVLHMHFTGFEWMAYSGIPGQPSREHNSGKTSIRVHWYLAFGECLFHFSRGFIGLYKMDFTGLCSFRGRGTLSYEN